MYFRQGENNILKDRSASEHCNEGCGLWAAEQPPPSKAGMAPCSHLSKPGAAWITGLASGLLHSSRAMGSTALLLRRHVLDQ